MTFLTLYEKPTCTTCRKVHAVLEEKGVDFQSVNYYLEPLSKHKLSELIRKMGIGPEELLRKNEDIYKDLGLAHKKLGREEMIDLMVKHPDLIQRPIAERGGKAVLARPAERIAEIL